MGKLADLWQQIRDMDDDDPRLPEVQKKINEVEQWMIDKGYKTDGITQWGKKSGDSNDYPHHTGFIRFEDIHMVAELNGLDVNYNPDGSVHKCDKCS